MPAGNKMLYPSASLVTPSPANVDTTAHTAMVLEGGKEFTDFPTAMGPIRRDRASRTKYDQGRDSRNK